MKRPAIAGEKDEPGRLAPSPALAFWARHGRPARKEEASKRPASGPQAAPTVARSWLIFRIVRLRLDDLRRRVAHFGKCCLDVLAQLG